jgi:hypothetical protein
LAKGRRGFRFDQARAREQEPPQLCPCGDDAEVLVAAVDLVVGVGRA